MNTIDNIFSLYAKACIQLATSLVIKSSDTATAMNNYLISHLGASAVDPDHPETWRYYKHLAGQYHSVDTVMTVVSMDTLETIEFNPTNLRVHRATAKFYSPGNRGYLELVDRFPTQELLICGILNPVDIKEAIKAKDFSILDYDSELVESNEYTLIQDLNSYVHGHTVRFYNPQYGISDPLYYAAFISNLVMLLVPAILNLRLERCNTNEAHSYHIRYYLTSNGIHDDYVDFLSKDQALYLYRNLKYLQLHLGKVETFKELVQVLMAWRNFPLDEFVMQHDLTTQIETLHPVPVFERKPVYGDVVASSRRYISLHEVLVKENKIAPGNIRQQEEFENEYLFRLENTLSNRSNTKLLESIVHDRSDSTQFTLEETLINQWLWMVKKNLYRSIVSIQNPRTGEFLPLDMRDAFILMTYAYYKAFDIELVNVPTVYAERVQRLPQPTLAELKGMVDSKYVTEADITKLLQTMPETEILISIEAFREQTIRFHQAAKLQYNLTAYVENHHARGYYATIVERMYNDVEVVLDKDHISYREWLALRNFNTEGMEPADYFSLYNTILKEATGVNLNSEKSLQSVHRAMLGILKDLSSYTIQLVGETNTTKITSLDWAMIRLGDEHAKFKHLFEQINVTVDINSLTGRQKETFLDDAGDFIAMSVAAGKQYHHFDAEFRLDINLKTKTNGIRLFLDSAPLHPKILTEPNYDTFNAMTFDEKMDFIALFK